MSEATTKTGVMKFWKTEKGFGFLRCDDGGPDIFVHVSAFMASGLREPARGARFQFTVETEADGRTRAANLVALPAAADDDKKRDDARRWNDDAA